MSKIKVAVIGCGQVSQNTYLPEFHRVSDRAELVAVCDLQAERAHQAQQKFGAKTFYTDLDKLLNESDAELVLNLTPHKTHVPVSLAALKSGRHVYTEKPMAQSVEDANLLIETAKSKHLKLSCAPSIMLFPTARRIKQLVADGAIGRITFARAQVLGPPTWGDFPPEHAWYFSSGCGPFFDEGVYPLTAITELIGPAKRVSAMGSIVIPRRTIPSGEAEGKTFPTEAEDSVHVHVDFGGVFASLDVSWCVYASRSESFEIHGDEGSLIGNPSNANSSIQLWRTSRRQWEVEEPAETSPKSSDHIRGVIHLVDCIRENRQPHNSGERSRHVIEIIVKALQSAKEGRTMTIETALPRGDGNEAIRHT